MKHDIPEQAVFSRRELLTRFIPGCGLMCAVGLVPGRGRGGKDSKEIHRFLRETDRRFSPKQLLKMRFLSDFVPTMKLFQEYLGEKELIEFLKKSSARRNFELGQRIARFRGKNDFPTFVEPFKNLREMLANTITRVIMEDTPEVFEMKVTECLTADVFKEAGAADIGYACVCHADFALPTGFNPKIKLERSRTIMTGDSICNHRYILT